MESDDAVALSRDREFAPMYHRLVTAMEELACALRDAAGCFKTLHADDEEFLKAIDICCSDRKERKNRKENSPDHPGWLVNKEIVFKGTKLYETSVFEWRTFLRMLRREYVQPKQLIEDIVTDAIWKSKEKYEHFVAGKEVIDTIAYWIKFARIVMNNERSIDCKRKRRASDFEKIGMACLHIHRGMMKQITSNASLRMEQVHSIAFEMHVFLERKPLLLRNFANMIVDADKELSPCLICLDEQCFATVHVASCMCPVSCVTCAQQFEVRFLSCCPACRRVT